MTLTPGQILTLWKRELARMTCNCGPYFATETEEHDADCRYVWSVKRVEAEVREHESPDKGKAT